MKTIRINDTQEIRVVDGRKGNFHLHTNGYYNATFETESEARRLACRYTCITTTREFAK